MTDTLDAQARAAAVRHIILDPEELAGSSCPSTPLDRAQRMRGGEFVSWDARRDAVMLLSPLLDLAITRPAFRTVELAISDPSLRRLRRVEAALMREQPREAELSCRSVAELLRYHQAALGCPIASARIAADSLDSAIMRADAGDFSHAFLCFRAACLWSTDAQSDASDIEYVGGPLRSRLAAFDHRAHVWLAAFRVIEAAERMIADEDAILMGGVGVAAREVVPVDDILGLAHARSEHDAGVSKRKAAAPAGRTLVVVPALTHLPKPSSTTQDRGDSPRAAYEPIAGKALPLRPAPDPHAFVECVGR